ncbi:NIF family HAD-type phosphatase [Chamaesiphon minutus]|uniref:TFIIF-interacting CTD phosphatase n=1 Tax=Chamaesiphon minutus (strain ATCC 27169 / PCC 6605) TaxID=1173020 RepID=K9UC19_CHAP6|nr:HAD family hydrolase [Chamaesiphon minutus]AFY91754.1 TFIIF-interacting CTD phosphatase [Chamaesiphon minutus PCC 6605]
MAATKKLLILDLDETLVYATETPSIGLPDFYVYDYAIYKRPYLDIFLATCLEWFNVAIWTSSGSDYATAVVAAIFPDPQALKFVWASDRCSIAYNYNYDLIDGGYPSYYSRKPLKKVKRRGYKLESIIAVDDTPKKWEQSYGNLVRIDPFEGDESDIELKYLLIYLEELKNVENVRSIEKRKWRQQVCT